MPKIAVIILAGGEGRRLGADVPKAFVQVGGMELYRHSLLRLGEVEGVCQRIIVFPPGHTCFEGPIAGNCLEVIGGEQRRDSAAQGFAVVDDDVEIVLIHDAARPFIRPEDAERVAEAAMQHGAAVLATPVRDTIKRGLKKDDLGVTDLETIPRDGLWAAQTPQAFRRDLYERALAQSESTDTDDAAMVERLGEPVVLVDGDPGNWKITTPADLALAEAILVSGSTEFRTGIGSDFHRLESGLPFRLGGVELDHDYGPVGHSDGDVILHAIVDGILGALALGDIGKYYPPTVDRLRGAESSRFVKETVAMAARQGFEPVNVSLLLHLERPKLGEKKREIADSVAAMLGISADRVNLSAKTGEGVGEVGAGRAVEVFALVTMRGKAGSDA